MWVSWAARRRWCGGGRGSLQHGVTGSGMLPDTELSTLAILFLRKSLIHSCRQSLCYSYQGTFISIFLYVIIPEYSCPLVTAGDWFLDPLVIPNRDAQVPHTLIKRPRTAGPLFLCIPHSQPTVQRASCCHWVTKSCQTLCDPMNCSTSAFPLLHCLPGVPGPIVVLKKLFSVLQFL